MIVCEIVRTGFDVRYVLLSDERRWKVSRESDNELCNYPRFVLYFKPGNHITCFSSSKKGLNFTKLLNAGELCVSYYF